MAAVTWASGLDLTVEFQQISGTWTDITPAVRAMSTSIPRSRAFGGMFPPGSASLILDNRDGVFSPARPASPYVASLYPGRPVRITAIYSAVGYSVWTGTVEDWGCELPSATATDAVAVVPLRQTSGRLADDKRAATAEVGASELTSARVSRVLTAHSWGFGSTIATGVAPMLATDMGGDLFSLIGEAVEIEGGACWCDPDGALIFEGRYALIDNARSKTSQRTFGPGAGETAYLGDDGLRLVSGVELVINQATRGNTGGTPRTSINATAQSTMGNVVYTDTPRTNLQGVSDVDAQSVADGITTLYGLPFVHPPQIMIRPNSAASWAQAFGRRIRDRITVKVAVPWTGTPLSIDCWIVGIAHTGRPGDWVTTFELEPATAFDGDPWWTLDSSLLDGSDRLTW
jgi:hypothetical protein